MKAFVAGGLFTISAFFLVLYAIFGVCLFKEMDTRRGKAAVGAYFGWIVAGLAAACYMSYLTAAGG